MSQEQSEAQANRCPIPDELETLRLEIAPACWPAFLPLLQGGVCLRCRLGLSVRQVLCGPLGIAPEYVSGRISTLFLNGRPVDDLDRVRVAAGDTLALSAAMPGLVGAVMRRGGYLAGLRDAISCRPADRKEGSGTGFITLKMFNKVMLEWGPQVLALGICLKVSSLLGVLPPGRGHGSARVRSGQGIGKPIALEHWAASRPDQWYCWQIVFRS